MTAAKLRMINGETMYSKPSRFIKEIPRYMLKMEIDELPKKRFGSSFSSSGSSGNFGNSGSFGGSGNTYSSSKDRFSSSNKNITYNDKNNIFGDNSFIKKGFGNLSSLSSTEFDKPKKTPALPIDYTVNDTVHHPTFGKGTVVDMVKKDDDYFVTVQFETAGQKKMKASFAKLKKL